MAKKIKTAEERWESGAPHSAEAEVMGRELRRIDEKYGDDGMDLRFGGDGDNGEHLLYLLDIYFELQGQDS